jgi:hypothetical protein
MSALVLEAPVKPPDTPLSPSLTAQAALPEDFKAIATPEQRADETLKRECGERAFRATLAGDQAANAFDEWKVATAAAASASVGDRVAAGSVFLDEHDPDWWRGDVERAIDLDALNLAFGDNCILGQRCPIERYGTDYSGYHWFGAYLAGTKPYEETAIDAWAIRYGFQAGRPIASLGEYEDLTNEWFRVIAARRAAGVTS